MTTLLLQLPPRPRLRAPGRAGEGAPAGEYDYLLIAADGRHVAQQGRLAAAQLPRAELVVAIPAEADIGWQRIAKLPRAGRQMRAALAGLLEEALLDDPADLHFALQPGATVGNEAWVAVTSREWLAQQLAALEAAQVFVDRVAPLSWPMAPPRGHFLATGLDDNPLALRWSHADGVAELSLAGGFTRQLFPPAIVEAAQWSAEPGVAAAAEQWLGAAVTLLTNEQRAVAALGSPWNLRQFELAQRTRGLRSVRRFWREFQQREWRPVRWGLAGLLVVQLIGINAMAWHQNSQLKQRRAELDATLTGAFPNVRAVLNAPVQMQREADTLRAAAGRAGPQDFETLLAAAAGAWPAERGPVDALSFETGRLTLSAAGWTEEQIQRMRSQLRGEGWALDSQDGRLTLHRDVAPKGARPSGPPPRP